MFAAGCWRPSTSSSLPDDTRPLHAGEIKEIVRDAYSAIDSSTEAIAAKLYSPRSSRSCRRPRARARRSETTFAWPGSSPARRSSTSAAAEDRLDPRGPPHGSSGRVVALDFLPEMLERTAKPPPRRVSRTSRCSRPRWTPFRCPTRASTTSSRTASSTSRHASGASSPSARVLVPGGKLSLSDLTVGDEELPTEILSHPATWAG